MCRAKRRRRRRVRRGENQAEMTSGAQHLQRRSPGERTCMEAASPKIYMKENEDGGIDVAGDV
jgi:hypothetical protein